MAPTPCSGPLPRAGHASPFPMPLASAHPAARAIAPGAAAEPQASKNIAAAGLGARAQYPGRHAARTVRCVQAVQQAAQPLEPSQPDARPRQYGEGQHAIVVGSGPAGILTALLLAQRGYQVDIYEKRPAPSEHEVQHGSRSIVFGLVPRGITGLKQAGIRLPERGGASPWLNGLAVSKGAYSNRNVDGKVKSSFMRLPAAVLLVERAALVEHMLLEMQRLEPDRIRLHYGRGLEGVDFAAQEARFGGSGGGGEAERARFDLLVGCDGRNSGVRAALQAADPGFTHEEHVSPRMYKGFHMMPPVDGVDLGDEEGACITFNVSGRVLDHNSTFWPTRRGTVTGHVSAPREWFETQPNVPESYRQLIETHFPRLPEAWRPQACQQLVEARASPNGAAIKCSKLHGPRTVLIGDAAHGVTPATGQGCNAALESAQVLAQVLDECEGNAEIAPAAFTEARLPDAHALFALDRAARSRNGADGLTFTLLATRFHMLLGLLLKKLAPAWHQGPAYSPLIAHTMPYSKIQGALVRDRNAFVALLAAAAAGFVALLRAAAPRVAACFA